MASSFTLFSSVRKYLMNGTIDLDTDTLKLALVTSSYTPAVGHDIWGDVSANEVAAVASPSNGYTTGGKALTGQAVTATDSPSAGKFDADDVTWTALTATFRYGILYAEKTVGGVVNPLIGYILFDTTPADITVSGVDWTVQWSSNGIITN